MTTVPLSLYAAGVMTSDAHPENVAQLGGRRMNQRLSVFRLNNGVVIRHVDDPEVSIAFDALLLFPLVETLRRLLLKPWDDEDHVVESDP